MTAGKRSNRCTNRSALSCWFGLTFLLVLGLRAENIPEPLQLIHADLLRGEMMQNEPVRLLEGNVYFSQGTAQMRCERAVHYVQSERVTFAGQVQIVTDDLALAADEIDYFSRLRRYIAVGHVILEDSIRTMSSRKLTFQEDTQTAYADEHFKLVDHSESMVLTGDSGEYQRRIGYVKVNGNLVFTRVDTVGKDTLVIYGSRGEMFDEGAKVIIKDSVRVRQRDLLASCDELVYSDTAHTIALSGDPRAAREYEVVNGDFIRLHLQGNEVWKIDVDEQARVSSTIDSLDLTHLLMGKKVEIFLQDQHVDSVHIKGQSTSYYYLVDDGAVQGLNRTIGDQLTFILADDQIERVVITSDPGISEGVFYPIDGHSIRKVENDMDAILGTIKRPHAKRNVR